MNYGHDFPFALYGEIAMLMTISIDELSQLQTEIINLLKTAGVEVTNWNWFC